MPKPKSYQCFLGIHENQKYTIEATGFKDLRQKLCEEFEWLRFGRWYKVKIPDPTKLPAGAKRFIIKDNKSYPIFGTSLWYLLIIPE